jgi:hypothetical protein
MAKTVVKGLSKNPGIVNTPYAPGFYKFEVTGGEETTSRAGNTMFVHTMKILEGPDQDRKIEGGKFTVRFPITEAEFTVAKLKDFIVACAMRVASDDGYDPAKAIGKEVWGQMTLGTGQQGTPQAQVNKFYSEEDFQALAKPSDTDD